MISGIIVGATVWSICFIVFLIYPDPLSFTLALLIGPFVSGYFGARLGGRIAAYVLIIGVTILVLSLSLVYIPNIAWEYPREGWAGVALFIALLVLGNALFVSFGALTGIAAVRSRQSKQRPTDRQTVEVGKDSSLRGTVPKMSDHLQARIVEIEVKEEDLQNDLTVLKYTKTLGQISPGLLEEREKGLQQQLLDIILEKERLIRKSKANLQ